jgi:TonB family protein
MHFEIVIAKAQFRCIKSCPATSRLGDSVLAIFKRISMPHLLHRFVLYAVLLIISGNALATKLPSEKEIKPKKPQSSQQAKAAIKQCTAKPLNQNFKYPSHLLNQLISGRVTLNLKLNRCGEVVSSTVAKSSGNAELDAASIEMVSKWVLDVSKLFSADQEFVYAAAPVVFHMEQ